MLKVESNQTLCRIINIFYLFGIWQNKDESSFREKTRKLFYFFYYILFQIFIVTCAFLTDDKDETIFLVSLEIVLSVVTIRLRYLLWKKKEILNFLYDPIVAHSTTDKEMSEKINKKLKKYMTFLHVYFLMIGMTSVLLIISSLPTISSDKKLPFFISFDFDFKFSEVVFWIAYVYALAALFCGTISVLITALIVYIMLNYSIEYEVLGIHLRNLGVDRRIKSEMKHWITSQQATRNRFFRDLIGLIRAHRNISETIEQFKSCFSLLFLSQIITSGISITSSAFVLAYVSLDNIIQIEFYTALLIYGFFEIFLVMFLANEISLSNDGLSYCLFECNWIEQSKSCKTCVIILGEVLKRRQQLVILKLYPMNLETFTSIINGAYSMFNIFKSLK